MVTGVVTSFSHLLRKRMLLQGGQTAVFGKTEITCPGPVCYIYEGDPKNRNLLIKNRVFLHV